MANGLSNFLVDGVPTPVSAEAKLPVQDYLRPGEAAGELYDALGAVPICDGSYISSATTTTCVTGAGVLHAITLGETAAGAITIYDNTAGSGTVMAVLKASIVEGTYVFNRKFTTGLTIVTAAASKLSVSFLQAAP